MRRIAVCSVVVLAVFGTTACAGGETQEEVEILEERVDILEDQVLELQVATEEELEEGPPQEESPQEEIEDTQ